MENDSENVKPTPLIEEPGTNGLNAESIKLEDGLNADNNIPIITDSELTNKKRKLNLKLVIIIVIVLGALAFVYFFKSLFIAAIVNGTPISRLAVVSKAEKASGKNILDMIITMKLINDEAQKQGIIVTKEEIDAAVKKIEDQVKSQGLTLDQALAQQGVTAADFQKQMVVQIELEKLLGDKIVASDAEITQYITDYQITIPEGQESTYREQIKDQIKQQKLGTTAEEFITNLRTASSIYYFVNY